MSRSRQIVEDFLAPVWGRLAQPPRGVLAHRYVDPGAGYTGQLWDWDCYFTLLAALPRLNEDDLARDCLDNFLDHQRADGSIPFSIHADRHVDEPARDPEGPWNSAKPLLAQLALLGPAGRDPAEAARVADALQRHLDHWATTQLHPPTGLLTWRSHRGSGADNHPGVYGRPQNSTAGVDLNCMAVAEHRALARLWATAGRPAEAGAAQARAERLAEAVRRHLWDPVAGDFCHVDLTTTTPAGVTQPASWVTPLRYRSWVGAWALWAGLATRDQAKAVLATWRRWLWCDHGLRTLSPTEPLYHVGPSANPSNWQGPVWTIVNHLAVTGLRRYGLRAAADALATATIRLLATDIESTGTLHEFYDPGTGQGVMGAGFLNWNLLAPDLVAGQK